MKVSLISPMDSAIADGIDTASIQKPWDPAADAGF